MLSSHYWYTDEVTRDKAKMTLIALQGYMILGVFNNALSSSYECTPGKLISYVITLCILQAHHSWPSTK